MGKNFEKIFSNKTCSAPFKNNQEYLNCEFACAEMLLTSYLKAKSSGKIKESKKDILQKFNDARFVIKSRLNASKEKFFAGKYVQKAYNLIPLEWFCTVAGIMVRLSEEYKKVFLEIDNQTALSLGSVLKLYFFAEDISEIENYYELYSSVLKRLNLLCFENENLGIDEILFENIMNNAEFCKNISGVCVRFPQEEENELVIRESTAKKLRDFINKPNRKIAGYYLHGASGIGKNAIINRTCDMLSKAIVYVDVKTVSKLSGGFLSAVMSAFREALFVKGFICFDNFEEILNGADVSEETIEHVFKTANNFSETVFVLSQDNAAVNQKLENLGFLSIHCKDLTNEESFKFWKSELSEVKLSEDVDVYETANKFTFTPNQIKNTVSEAARNSLWNENKKIDKQALCTAAYGQVLSNLSEKATLIKKKHTWQELVLHGNQKEIIKRACDRIKYKHIVYDKWGMNKKVLYGRGLSMLFTGPPGTGKTMAAQVVAKDLGLEIYKVDLSKVVSKYIGESEKNLGEIFDSAKKSNVILLFDETDALFGKRTEVKDSHDKNANLETSYLLQKMEEFDGITIMTTNFLENIDKAFFRRISYVVHFAFPDASARKEIWQKMFPKETPLAENVDFNFLSKNFELSGGSIKNVVISSSFMAAADSKSVEMKHIVKALEYELKKQGKIVSKDDFGEYGYLIDKF